MRVALTIDVDASNGKSIQWLLTQLFALNVGWLSAQKKKIPPLYSTSVIYRPEPWMGQVESFDSIPVCWQRGWGDCDDLAAWRAAELWVQGIKAYPVVVETPTSRPGNRRWHCVVYCVGSHIEDPSVRLGMKVL